MGRDLGVGPFNPQSAWIKTRHFPDPLIHGLFSPHYLNRELNGLGPWVSGPIR